MIRESKTRSSKERGDPILGELESIKRLIAVMLMKAGTPHSELAAILQMDRADVSRMLPSRKFKRFEKNGQE